MVLAEANDLYWLGEGLFEEYRSVEPVVQDASVWPKCLADHIVDVSIDCGDGDVPFGFGTAQNIRPKQDHITGPYRLLAELAE